MIVPDVNVLVHAWQPSSPQHEALRTWLEEAVNGSEVLGLAHTVLSGSVRVLTHPRVFERPADAGEVLERVARLREQANTVDLMPTDRTWPEFAELCRTIGARGNDVPDAYIAALTISNGGTLVTADRGFTRFANLRCRHPLDG